MRLDSSVHPAATAVHDDDIMAVGPVNLHANVSHRTAPRNTSPLGRRSKHVQFETCHFADKQTDGRHIARADYGGTVTVADRARSSMDVYWEFLGRLTWWKRRRKTVAVRSVSDFPPCF